MVQEGRYRVSARDIRPTRHSSKFRGIKAYLESSTRPSASYTGATETISVDRCLQPVAERILDSSFVAGVMTYLSNNIPAAVSAREPWIQCIDNWFTEQPGLLGSQKTGKRILQLSDTFLRSFTVEQKRTQAIEKTSHFGKKGKVVPVVTLQFFRNKDNSPSFEDPRNNCCCSVPLS